MDKDQKNGINSPEEAREWVRKNAENGADGIKFFGARPDIFSAALKENAKYGLRSACHHAQMDVAWMNVLQTARLGLTLWNIGMVYLKHFLMIEQFKIIL